jgi:hypothetical protein
LSLFSATQNFVAPKKNFSFQRALQERAVSDFSIYCPGLRLKDEKTTNEYIIHQIVKKIKPRYTKMAKSK